MESCVEPWVPEPPHFDAGLALDPATHGGGGAYHRGGGGTEVSAYAQYHAFRRLFPILITVCDVLLVTLV